MSLLTWPPNAVGGIQKNARAIEPKAMFLFICCQSCNRKTDPRIDEIWRHSNSCFFTCAIDSTVSYDRIIAVHISLKQQVCSTRGVSLIALRERPQWAKGWGKLKTAWWQSWCENRQIFFDIYFNNSPTLEQLPKNKMQVHCHKRIKQQ